MARWFSIARSTDPVVETVERTSETWLDRLTPRKADQKSRTAAGPQCSWVPRRYDPDVVDLVVHRGPTEREWRTMLARGWRVCGR